MEERDSDLSLLVYLVALAVICTGFVYGLVWLLNPRSIPNPGLAAYKPPAGTSLFIAKPYDPPPMDIVAMESAALGVADKANAGMAYAKAAPAETAKREEAKPEEPKPKRTAQSATRRRVTVAAPHPVEERRPMWGGNSGFAQQRPASPFGGRWF